MKQNTTGISGRKLIFWLFGSMIFTIIVVFAMVRMMGGHFPTAAEREGARSSAPARP